MVARHRANPLALAVLASLLERPMHPYEISTTLRTRGKHESIKLNYGSLYTVVDGLAKRELITATETERAGRRPERTVYALTDEGRRELADWLAELLREPVKEFTQFEAALSLMACLPPDEVAPLLTERAEQIEYELVQGDAMHERAVKQGVPRLFLIEYEYRRTLRVAELEWVRQLAAEIESGVLPGVAEWRAFHDGADPFAVAPSE
jgi:DNA-binding PadR family transcriptional regulator